VSGKALDKMTTFLIDGREHRLNGERNLFETLKSTYSKREGFCYHPLLENSRSCLLCQIYDEKRKKVVLSCQVIPHEGDRFLTQHEVLTKAKKEVNNLYHQGHDFLCSRCSHQKGCTLKDFFSQPLHQLKEAPKETLAEIKLNDFLGADFSQCIHCSLCTDFEKEHSSRPILLESEKHPQVVGHLDHNYGVNLIDLCPTGCFHLLGESNFNISEIGRDFCRGCDRLCETEVLNDRSQSGLKVIRARAPHGATHWVCDDVNRQWRERLKIPLTRPLKKQDGQWRPYEGVEASGPWHILAPANLPDAMWSLLERWNNSNSQLTLEFYHWPERHEQKGLLRAQYHFYQEQRMKLEEAGLVKPPQQQQKVLLIAPEWIANEKKWSEVLDNVRQFSRKVFVGPSINFELYDIMDELHPIKSYDLMAWSGRNYQNELHLKAGAIVDVDLFEEGTEK
jgi:ferredoxin-like protein FixX